MSIFEASMLVCFGISWPLSIIKTLRTKKVTGKSPLFLIIVDTGYVCGILHKLLFSFDPVIIFYIINFITVLIDMLLYFHYSRKEPREK